MKTKKGFTLIELIVVIAIIGILGAILIPLMMGYTKKSKIQSANTASNTMLKAANSALEELDEAECTFNALKVYVHHANDPLQNVTAPVADDADTLFSYMTIYSDDVYGSEIAVVVKEGHCIAASTMSGLYYGTSPIVYTNKNYGRGKEFDPTNVKSAVKDAIDKYNTGHPNSAVDVDHVEDL